MDVGAQNKAPSAPYKCADPAYRTLPPVHDSAIAASVFQHSMEAVVTITQRELLSLSPKVHSKVRDSTTTCRIPNKEYPTSQNFYEDTEGLDSSNLTMTYLVTIFPVFDAYNNPIPKDVLIVEDEVETYYRCLNSGENPDLNHLIVTGESHSICSVHVLIDNSDKVECILDPGCQIIAMSEAICHDLGLAYDPSIVLHMQSANGNLDQLLGLTCNIPFQIGAITMYWQVHVISMFEYDVLLGRPFDVLTESMVRNFANEDQTITIQDPNTGKHITVPTRSRSRKAQKCIYPHHNKISQLSSRHQHF